MSEFSATQRMLELSATLWLVPAVPLVAALYAFVRGATGVAVRAESLRVVASATAISAGALVLDGVRLLAPDAPSMLLCQMTSTLRIGTLDSAIAFTLTPAIAIAALVVLAVSAAALWVAWPGSVSTFVLAGLPLASSGALTALLADDALLCAVGFALLALGVAVLGASARGASTAVVGLAVGGSLSLLAAVGVLSWAMAGTWTVTGDYLPDYRARLLAVQSTEALPSAGAAGKNIDGFLTLTALPGATVVVGGADLCARDADDRPGGIGIPGRPCRRRAVSPFVRVPLPATLHDITVHTGPGSYDAIVTKARVSRGVETTLVLSGATLSPRLLSDQLALRDASGVYPMRAALDGRKLLGAAVDGLACVLLMLAMAAFALGWPKSTALARAGATRLSAGAVVGMGFVAVAGVLAKYSFVFALAPTASVACALVLGAGALWLAARAAHAADSRLALVLAGGAQLGVALTGVCGGAGELALIHAAAAGGGLVALLLALDDRRLLGALSGRADLGRVAGLAAVCVTAAPVPIVGAFWPRERFLRALFAIDGAGLPGAVPVVLALLATGVGSFAVWRVVRAALAPAPKGDDGSSGAPAPAGWLVAGVAAVAGTLAAAGPLAFGDTLVPRLVAPLPVDAPGTPLTSEVELALALCAIALPVIGFWLARRRYHRIDARHWSKTEAQRWGASWLAPPAAVAPAGLPEVVATLSRGALAVQAMVAGASGANIDAPVEDERSEPPKSEVRPRAKKRGKRSP